MYGMSVLSIEVDQAAGETASTRHHTTAVPVPVIAALYKFITRLVFKPLSVAAGSWDQKPTKSTRMLRKKLVRDDHPPGLHN